MPTVFISTSAPAVVNAAPTAPATPTVTVTQPTCATATATITVNTPAPGAGITYSIDGVTYTNTTGIFTGVADNATYNVTVKNAAGCISTSAPAVVNAAPTAPATPTVTVTQPTCATATATITVNTPAPGAGITYSIDGVTYTNTTGIFTGVADNATYNVTVKNAAGCISTSAPAVVNAAPTAPATPTVTVTQPTCATATATITVNTPAPGAGITYSIDGVTYTNTTGIFTGVADNATYNVTVKNAAGCISTSAPAVVNAAPTAPATPTVTVTQPTCATATATITVNTPAPGAGITYSIDGVTYTNTTGIFTGVADNATYNVT